jgi:hypothetical protein
VCDACQRAKSHQLPYPKSTSISNHPLELVFSDIWGPAPDSASRYKYYVSFVDDYSKFTWIYLLKFKSEVFQNSVTSKILWRGYLIEKFFLFKPTGEVNMKLFIPSLQRLASLTLSLARTHTNKMALASVNTAT